MAAAAWSSIRLAGRQMTAGPLSGLAAKREFDITATERKNNAGQVEWPLFSTPASTAESFTMLWRLPIAGILVGFALVAPVQADYPQPSPYPVSWELTVTHSLPKRILVQGPGDSNPGAYWYLTYHVVNNTDRDKILFYPNFEMMLEDGQVIRSDMGVSPSVFDAIKQHEHLKYLQGEDVIGGELRQGEDQSKDGVAIWAEPRLRMGTFTIFCSGFWGESATVTVDGKDVTLHKTLQLTYHLDSDENHPGGGDLVAKDELYVMR
jgi:hypothetical protein